MNPLSISPFITEAEIQNRIQKLGATLTHEYKNQSLVAICVLKGSLVFFSDLIREIKTDIVCDFIGLSSYGNATKSSGEVKLTLDLHHSIRDRHVLIVEDIVDTGLTLSYLQRLLKARNPKSLKTVSLLMKPEALQVECEVNHIGFKIPNDFVVGYGLDYQNLYRNLPFIGQVTNLN